MDELDNVSNVVMFFLTSIVAFATVFLDYIFRDRRTKKFKCTRKFLLVILGLFVILGSYTTCRSEEKEKRKDEKINSLRDSISSLQSLIVETSDSTQSTVEKESKIILLEVKSKAKNTIAALDDLNAVSVRAENEIKKQINENIGEVQKLKYPINDDFSITHSIQFKDTILSKLAKEIISKRGLPKHLEFLFIEYAPEIYFPFPPPYDSLRLKLYNKFENCTFLIEFQGSQQSFGLYQYFNIKTETSADGKGVNRKNPISGFKTFFYYNSESDEFMLTIRNMPVKILYRDSKMNSLYDLKNSNVKLGLEFSNGKHKSFKNFEVGNIEIWMNDIYYISIRDFYRFENEFFSKNIKLLF